MRYKPGDIVVCRSRYGTDYLTEGKEYEVIKGEELSSFLGSSDLMIVVECDDGKERPISKLKFVPAAEVIAKRGKLEVLKTIKKRR